MVPLQNPHLEGSSFFWPAGPIGVVLSHGYTATTAEVRLLAKVLHERGYSVAGPLLPGHGTQIEDLNRCRWEDWVGALETAYHQLAAHCERVFVGGESLGGLLALYLASEHPEIAGVMAYAAALKLRSQLNAVLIPLLAPFIPVMNKSRSGPAITDERWQGYTQDALHAGRQLLKFQRVVRERLPRIAQPILIVQGRLDGAVSADAPGMISAGVSSQEKQVVWFERSTHCVLLDQEIDEVHRVTLDFIGRVTAAAA